jgi:phenol 2-monooxygenase
MVEDIFIDDLRLRGVEVMRSSPFNRYSAGDSGIQVACDDLNTGSTKILKTQFLVGCDGAHSKVRKSMLGEMDGASGNSAWGVLDGGQPHCYRIMIRRSQTIQG